MAKELATPFPVSETPVGIEPGTYRIARSAWSVGDYSVSFPAGWSVQYGHVYLKHSDTPDELGLYAVLVDSIYADACAGSEGVLVSVGPTVDDLAEALIAQAGPVTSGPVDTMLGGYPARRLDMAVPEGFDLATCNLEGIGLQIWYASDADKYFVLLPGTRMSVYIVDVGGERQVFLAGGHLASDDDERELQTILDSIQLDPTAHRAPGTGGLARVTW
jgi:hypothetical protein